MQVLADLVLPALVAVPVLAEAPVLVVVAVVAVVPDEPGCCFAEQVQPRAQAHEPVQFWVALQGCSVVAEQVQYAPHLQGEQWLFFAQAGLCARQLLPAPALMGLLHFLHAPPGDTCVSHHFRARFGRGYWPVQYAPV